MSWKYQVGKAANGLLRSALSSQAFPLTRYFPRGVNWLYDVQRFAGTRKLLTAFDVGANIGQTTDALIQFLPNARIYSFEPISETFATLAARFEGNANVKCIRKALSDEPGASIVQLRDLSEYNSLLVTEQGRQYLNGKTESVAVTTIDLFCAEHAIEQIDILKMDVQGYELRVLAGARGMITRNNIGFVFAEVGFRHNDAEIQMFGELNEKMAHHGYMFSGFYECFRYGLNKQFTLFANALYINPSYRPRSSFPPK